MILWAFIAGYVVAMSLTLYVAVRKAMDGSGFPDKDIFKGR